MNQLATISADTIASNLRRSGPVNVSDENSFSLHLEAFRLSRDAGRSTALTPRDLRCVKRCAGELVDAVVSKIPGSTVSFLSSAMTSVGVYDPDDQAADLRLRVFSLLCELEDLDGLEPVPWVASRLGRRKRTMTADAYKSTRRPSDLRVLAVAKAINVNIDVPEGLSKGRARGSYVPGADQTQVEEELLKQCLERLERSGHDPESPDTRAIAKRQLQRDGIYASLAALPQLIQLSTAKESLTPSPSDERTQEADIPQPAEGSGAQSAPFSDSRELFVDLLTDKELASATQALSATGSGSITAQTANRIMEETRSLLCSPQLHWARLVDLPHEQVHGGERRLVASGVAGLRARAADRQSR